MATQVIPDRFIVDKRGKPQAVILSFVNYQKLARLVEDREDARELRRAIRTSRGTITHAKLLARLRRRRLL